MELIGSLFLVLAVAFLVFLFVARPFLLRTPLSSYETRSAEQEQEHLRSSLLAERDRVLTALQELEFDNALGKIPQEDYPLQRAALMKAGADVLRRLDHIEGEKPFDDGAAAQVEMRAVEDRIEAAVAARRADAGTLAPDGAAAAAPARGNGNSGSKDALEDLIASRKRVRKESAAGFCPRCGKPVQKSDKFCAKCGAVLS